MADENTATFSKADLEAAAAAAAKAATDAATAPLLAQIAELSAKVNAAPPAKKADEPREYTRAEINAAIAKGDIDQDAGDRLWDTQQERKFERLAKEAAEKAITTTNLNQTVEGQIGDYSELAPKAFEAGTPEYSRVRKQYDYLVKIGQPATKSTELAALTLALGDLDALRATSRASLKRETHEETGGAGDGDGDNSGNSDGVPKGLKLTARERAYYQQKIDRGIYKDWKAVEKERAFAVQRASRAA